MNAGKGPNMSGASRTKQLLADSLKELMRKMPLEKISVSDIVEYAGIGRNTFYYHFQDKYDLVNWIFQTESTRFFAEHITSENWASSLECIEDYLQQNREFYCNALAYTGQNSLQEYMFDTICSQVAERVHEIEIPELRDLTADERQFIGEFVASAITGMILRWARRGMKDDPSRYRDCVRRLCDGTLIHAYLNQPGLPERGREN